jgi:hypothetical protein
MNTGTEYFRKKLIFLLSIARYHTEAVTLAATSSDVLLVVRDTRPA